MIVAEAVRVFEDNIEATEAWNGPLFDVWTEYRHVVAEGVSGHGELAVAANPVRYPFRSFDGASVIDRQRSGTRTWDINTDGVDHYGLYADWVEDLRLVAGQQIVDDLANGAEAYLQLWERAEKAAGD